MANDDHRGSQKKPISYERWAEEKPIEIIDNRQFGGEFMDRKQTVGYIERKRGGEEYIYVGKLTLICVYSMFDRFLMFFTNLPGSV